MKRFFILFLILSVSPVNSVWAQIQRRESAEIVLNPEMNLVKVFKGLASSKTIKRIVFEPGNYVVNDTLFLPRTGSLIIIDGQGSNITTNRDIPIFFSLPRSQKEAMIFNKTRYQIKDFGKIQGGAKGIFIGSSFNTEISNIEFIGQSQAAIDLVFCLMSSVEEILVTNPKNDGIVLRSGLNSRTNKAEWTGASYNNSQCNHSIIKSCRVYNKKGCTGMSFKILQSTGVRLVNCISEGWANKRAVFFDAEKCTTAKLFSIQNFHLEHLPTEGALCFRGNGSIVEVDGLFLQHGEPESPAIWIMSNSNYIFKNVAWWPQRAWVKSSHSPSVVIEHCTKDFYNTDKWVNADKPGQKVYPNYFTKSSKLIR